MIHPVTITAKGHDYPDGCAVVYCGRGSVLGNPHVMRGKSDRERNRVCDLYEKEFPTPAQEAECQHIARLAKRMPVFLECFCTPKRCHVETAKRRIDEILQNP